jgi:hypothetical protein
MISGAALWFLGRFRSQDDTCKCVEGSQYPYGRSPREIVIPVYDPIAFANGQQTARRSFSTSRTSSASLSSGSQPAAK